MRLFHCPTVYNPATLPLWQMLQQVMGKNFVPVKPPEMDRLSYPPLARELYEERVRKPNAIKVSVYYVHVYIQTLFSDHLFKRNYVIVTIPSTV